MKRCPSGGAYGCLSHTLWSMPAFIHWFDELSRADAAQVGGKNASLGELMRTFADRGVGVPGGFATSTEAYERFLAESRLRPAIEVLLGDHRAGRRPLDETGRAIRRLFVKAPLPAYLAEALRTAYRALSARYAMTEVDVAVRASVAAGHVPEARFARQQESFLNVQGEDELLAACRRCYASLFTDRAIRAREEQSLGHDAVALSIGVQKMVRADKAGAGALSTTGPEAGGAGAVCIRAAWGLGENVIRGTVAPDAYMVRKQGLASGAEAIVEKRLGAKQQKLVYALGGSRVTQNVPTTPEEQRRFVLSDAEALQLARWGAWIEVHYGRPVAVEWAKDGETGGLYVVQARPEPAVRAPVQAGGGASRANTPPAPAEAPRWSATP